MAQQTKAQQTTNKSHKRHNNDGHNFSRRDDHDDDDSYNNGRSRNKLQPNNTATPAKTRQRHDKQGHSKRQTKETTGTTTKGKGSAGVAITTTVTATTTGTAATSNKQQTNSTPTTATTTTMAQQRQAPKGQIHKQSAATNDTNQGTAGAQRCNGGHGPRQPIKNKQRHSKRQERTQGL